MAGLHLQQRLPAVTRGEPEAGRRRPAEPAHASAAPPQTALHLREQDGQTLEGEKKKRLSFVVRLGVEACLCGFRLC